MSDEDKSILEAYRKKAAEEYKVEDTELIQWEKESDVDAMAEIAMSWKPVSYTHLLLCCRCLV